MKSSTTKTARIILGDSAEKEKKNTLKTKLNLLTGKNWNTLSAKEKDALLRLSIERAGFIDSAGNVV
jgi:hypothetical protein